jgi:hypothetical protein
MGGSALQGIPGVNGMAAAYAALRNYLQSLQKEVADKGVFVGITILTVIILGSAYADITTNPYKLKEVHADELAASVYQQYIEKKDEIHLK